MSKDSEVKSAKNRPVAKSSDKESRRSGPRRAPKSRKPNRELTTGGSGASLDAKLRKIVNDSVERSTFIVFDIETTGGNPERNGITEICALKIIDGQVVDRFYSMINPMISIPPIVRRMTGITNQMVAETFQWIASRCVHKTHILGLDPGSRVEHDWGQ
jgi:DNA polymerase III epsilon subunit-like protein